MEDILDLDDGLKNEEAFFLANTISRANDGMYRLILRPWVRTGISHHTAEMLRQMHPLRSERYAFSDLNPFMHPVKHLAETVKPYRQPVSAENPFLAMETIFSEAVQTGLNYYRDMRDLTQEFWFKSLYGAHWMNWLYSPLEQGDPEKSALKKIDKKTRQRRKAWAQMAAVEGGFIEAMVRIFIAVAGANRMLDKRQFALAEKIIQANSRLKRPTADHYKVMVKEQARVLELNEKLALEGLARLLPTRKDRIEAFAIAKQIANADEKLDKREQAMLVRIGKILALDEAD
jgi:tellurite resistance protein